MFLVVVVMCLGFIWVIIFKCMFFESFFKILLCIFGFINCYSMWWILWGDDFNNKVVLYGVVLVSMFCIWINCLLLSDLVICLSCCSG